MRTVKHTAAFQISQPIKILFPLFSAEGEKLWVPGWDYENVMGSKVMNLLKGLHLLSTKALFANGKVCW